MVAIITASRIGFRRMSLTSRGCVIFRCRLLVIVRLLWLVVLVFEGSLELHGGVLLFNVGCWLLCDCYIWSYWFPNIVSLFMHTALLVAVIFWLSTELLELYKEKFFYVFYILVIFLLSDVLYFNCVVSWVVKNETAKTWWTCAPGKPLQVYYLFFAALY